jgi:hypothetical protein
MTVQVSADTNAIDARRTKRKDKNFLINSLSLWYRLGNVIALFSLASEILDKSVRPGRRQRRPEVEEIFHQPLFPQATKPLAKLYTMIPNSSPKQT